MLPRTTDRHRVFVSLSIAASSRSFAREKPLTASSPVTLKINPRCGWARLLRTASAPAERCTLELAPTLKKGMQLYVTGRLTLDKWGSRHIEPCEIGRQRQRSPKKPAPTNSPAVQQQVQPASIIPSDMNDDIPF